MHSNIGFLLATLLAAGARPAAGRPAVEAQSSVAGNFEIQELAAGVYAVIRKDPPGLMCDGNSVLILNDEDVIVVDAPESSRAVVAALRKLTTKPVRYVINTHWHDDHVIGNQIYRDAWPGVEFIAHARTREYRLAEHYLEVVPGAEIVLPTVMVEDRLTLHRGSRIIDIRAMGSGHTAGDLVVHLPREGILVTGDLVVWPVPLVGAEQSHIADWSLTLDKLRALRPAVIVPGHGPVLHGDSYLALLARLFASVREQTAAAVAQGKTLDETRKSVDLGELRKVFAGASPVRNALFERYVAGPAVAAAFREATAK